MRSLLCLALSLDPQREKGSNAKQLNQPIPMLTFTTLEIQYPHRYETLLSNTTIRHGNGSRPAADLEAIMRTE
jgi:hypothetical protein